MEKMRICLEIPQQKAGSPYKEQCPPIISDRGTAAFIAPWPTDPQLSIDIAAVEIMQNREK